MPGHEHDRDVHQPVVQEDRAREAEAVVALAVPEEDSRDGEQHRERRCQRGVQLLARVEAALRAREALQPQAVVAVEVVELADRPAQAAPVAEDDDERDRDEPGEPGVEVDVLDEARGGRRARSGCGR